MSKGMDLMMKSFGVDPSKIISDFTALKDGVIKTLTQLDERMTLIQVAEARIEQRQTELLNRMEELCQMNQRALTMSSQVHLVQQPQSQPQTMPQENPLSQPQPQSQQPQQ